MADNPDHALDHTHPAARPASGGAAPAASPRAELLGLAAPERRAVLAAFMEREGEPSYRSSQVEEWIFTHRARSFDEITTLPAELRARLDAAFTLTTLEPAYIARSEDGTVKHLWRLDDGEQVESVLIPAGGRTTLCLSSQVGCALACEFCATGHFGFRRQLRAAEIVGQYREATRFATIELAARAGSKRGRHAISNVVYMGMGEPLANLDAVIASLQVLNRGFGVGARRITVSTVGLIPGIVELARQPESYELAVSLHAPLHDLRLELMPIERRYPLPELFEALREYQARKKRRISFEYTLIRGVNDDPELAETLADLTYGLTSFVNLIPFNPIPYRPDWSPSPPARIRAFAKTLDRRGVENAVRTPRGRDIAAACGQLRLARMAPEA